MAQYEYRRINLSETPKERTEVDPLNEAGAGGSAAWVAVYYLQCALAEGTGSAR